jgi:hypothetical protein
MATALAIDQASLSVPIVMETRHLVLCPKHSERLDNGVPYAALTKAGWPPGKCSYALVHPMTGLLGMTCAALSSPAEVTAV